MQRERCQQVDHLEPGFELLDLRRLLLELGRCTVNRRDMSAIQVAGLVDRLADNIHDAAQSSLADRNTDRRTAVANFLTAGQTVGRIH